MSRYDIYFIFQPAITPVLPAQKLPPSARHVLLLIIELPQMVILVHVTSVITIMAMLFVYKYAPILVGNVQQLHFVLNARLILSEN